ncbi:MAG: hypothetical protein ACYDCO_11180 [Armatimonadota bacterium]
MRQAVLWFVLVIPGVVGVVVFGWISLQDYTLLREAYQHFMQVAQTFPGQNTLFVAHTEQNIHRINLTADGIWTLLCAIYAAVGVHGLCLLPPKPRA